MKSFLLLTTLIVSACAQLTAPTRNYNVTSPVSNGPYVVNQILPCTYRLFSDADTSELSLQITMASDQTTNATNATVIAEKADVSTTAEFVKREGNQTFYEHSINFQIPSTTKPGPYNVIFRDSSTNTKLTIPIEIRPAAAPTPSSSAALPTNPSGQSSLADALNHAGTGAIHSPAWLIVTLAMAMSLTLVLMAK